MHKVSRFRKIRLYCRIPQKELALTANISGQRLCQIELRQFGAYPQNPERLIKALEIAIETRKKELEKAEYICKNERQTLFDYIEEYGDNL